MKHFYTIWPYQNNLSLKYVENLDIEKKIEISFLWKKEM